MALTIESTTLNSYILSKMRYSLGSRYHAYRVCGHATVVHDSSLRERLSHARGIDLATREALEWQADQDEDLDEPEVMYHLHQQAKSSPVFANAFSRTERSDAITTLVASCSIQSPSDLAIPQGSTLSSARPLSSFRRLSIRKSIRACPVGIRSLEVSTLGKIVPNAREYLAPDAPSINGKGHPDIFVDCVVWHLQYDVVDLLSTSTLPTWRPGKRRRTKINPFHQMPAPPEQDAPPGHHPPETKRFKGVRYRTDRRTWTAEMKPPKSKSKVSFGEFKSQAQAARAIDAAFHYYDKTHLLNFPDTPGILATRPLPAGVLNDEDKLGFVKEQVKWLASMASTLPSSPPSVPLEIPESSSRGRKGDTSGFRTVSAMASSLGVAGESYDGTSQPLPLPRPDALAEFEGHGLMEPPVVGAVAIMGSLDEHQGMLESILEDFHVAPSWSGRWSPGGSVQITHVVDESSALALMNLTKSAEPSCESPGSWMNFLAMSPPASMPPLPPLSPSSFPADVTHGLLESEGFGGGEWLRG